MDVTFQVFSVLFLSFVPGWLVDFKWISLLLHTQYIEKSSLWKNIDVIIIKIIWTKVIRLYLLYLKPVVVTFLFPIISFHLKYHICAIDTNQINFFWWLSSFYIHFPAVFLLRKVSGNMLLNIIWYLGKKLLSYGRSWSCSSRHIVGFRMQTAVSLKKELQFRL